MTRRNRRKLAWFREGQDALSRLGPAMPAGYVCPLCLTLFEEPDFKSLTFEDVPPKSLGGRPLLLTCKECNGRAGGTAGVDTHAGRMEAARRFLQRRMTKPVIARMRVKDLDLNVSVQSSEAATRVVGLGDQNPPGRTDQLREILEDAAQRGAPMPKFTLSFPQFSYSRGRASVSWLRTAYLAAFAVLGYRYVLRACLEPVRAQIRKPEEEALPRFHLVKPEFPDSQRAVIVIGSPEWARGLVVQMGPNLITLPFLDGDVGYHERVSQEGLAAGSVQFRGKAFEWPRKCWYVMDRGPAGLQRMILAAAGVGVVPCVQ